MRRAVCFCSLHPTRDVILEAPEFSFGEVNRARRWFTYPGGKALNAARTLGLLGGTARAIAVAPPGWDAFLRDFLRRFSVSVSLHPVSSQGRICVMLSEGKRETVINTDQPMRFSAREMTRLAGAIRRAGQTARFVVFAGSPPPELGLTRLKSLFRIAGISGAGLVIDQAGRNLRAALACAPWLIKPNLREFESLIGRKVRSFADAVRAAEGVRRNGTRRILLSLGARGTLFCGPEGRWFAPAMKARSTGLSEVGCGDALLGGFLKAVADGAHFDEALRWGVAAATANLYQRGACLMSDSQVRALKPGVTVRAL